MHRPMQKREEKEKGQKEGQEEIIYIYVML
jgi:hypothetical protein